MGTSMGSRVFASCPSVQSPPSKLLNLDWIALRKRCDRLRSIVDGDHDTAKCAVVYLAFRSVQQHPFNELDSLMDLM